MKKSTLAVERCKTVSTIQKIFQTGILSLTQSAPYDCVKLRLNFFYIFLGFYIYFNSNQCLILLT